MVRATGVAFIAALAISPPNAIAAQDDDPTSVRGMMEFCSKPQNSSKFAYCMGSVDGVIGMHGFYSKLAKAVDIFCIPDGVTLIQTVEVFKKWSAANPADWHQKYVVGVSIALREAFPCPTK